MARTKKTANAGANLGFEAKLWQAADALRNNMDAAEYKHVVLGLIFLKYISDAFEAKHAELLAQRKQGADPEDADEYRAASIFWVPKEARWSHLKAKAPQPTIGKLVDDAMTAIERDNPTLKAVLPKDYARPGLDKRPQKLDRDLRTLSESKQPFDDLLQVIAEERPLEVLPMEFAGRAVQHPLFSMMRWYLKSLSAVCLTTGVSLRKNMGKKYQLELDHIFPFSRLKNAGYGKGNRVKYALAQEFTNRALLTQVANRSKAAMDPAVYLAEVAEKFPKALSLQCIPEDRELWKLANYEQFLEARRRLLASQINEFLSRITATEEAGVPATIEDLINEGESDELEFKATLRWDLKEGVASKKLEDVIVKTVAAFANTQGGTLVIGVDDDGLVVGLEHDYHSLGDTDRDKFELHLHHLLNQQLGVAFVTSRVQVRFHEVGGADVCQVDIAAGKEPVIVTVKDKNAQSVEKFYVRSGNASHELPLSEMNAYVKERFH